jgi:hypothetical protein
LEWGKNDYVGASSLVLDKNIIFWMTDRVAQSPSQSISFVDDLQKLTLCLMKVSQKCQFFAFSLAELRP